jgi:hypothetical protein
VFSEEFSEGQMRDIDDGFPPDSNPYNDDYDYMSDSDLEDEEEPHPNSRDTQALQTETDSSNRPSPRLNRPLPPRPSSTTDNNNLSRMGKVAVIRDMGAVTYV